MILTDSPPRSQPDTEVLVYFNFYNNYLYSNLVNVANLIYNGTGYPANPQNSNYNKLNNLNSIAINHIPTVRIPLNADYWLNGSGPNSKISINLGSGQNMTSNQYQNMIIAMVYYLMNPMGNNNTNFTGTCNGCVVILDLHWNFSDDIDESGSYTTGLPVRQTAMAVANNSIAFWNSISQTFGVNSNGNELYSTTCSINNTSNTATLGGGTTYTLTAEMKKNIFFELYNEPFLDNITVGGVAYGDYEHQFDMYILGSQDSQGSTITEGGNTSPYNTAGMGSIYNTIRIDNNCSNIIILSGAEDYAYLAGFNYVTYETPNNFIYNSFNTGNSCYNCWTKLNDAIKGLNGVQIPVMNNDGTLSGTYYTPNSNGLINVMANIHPYSNGYSKFPGYMYNTTITSTNEYPNNGNQNPNLCNFLEALQLGSNPYYTVTNPTSVPYSHGTSDCSNFQISFPIISTEFGEYNLPWISKSGTSYTTDYNSNPNVTSQGTSADWTDTQTTIGSTKYWGQFVDASGISTNAPFNVGIFEGFKQFNVSFTVWALVPNVNAFNQNQTSQVNYSYTGSTLTLPLLQSSNLNNTNPGQTGFDMNFCFQKYYLGVTGPITE